MNLGLIVLAFTLYICSHVYVYREGRIHGRQEVLDGFARHHGSAVHHEHLHEEDS